MSDPLGFLRESTDQDLRTVLETLITRVNGIDVRSRGTNGGWSLEVNPVAMFTSGVPRQWTGAKPVTVYVIGGTVSAISITGIAPNATPVTLTPGLTSGTFRLVPGDSITITYSVAPTWYWYSD